MNQMCKEPWLIYLPEKKAEPPTSLLPMKPIQPTIHAAVDEIVKTYVM